jgi:gamma-glutamylputrescine oxidase
VGTGIPAAQRIRSVMMTYQSPIAPGVSFYEATLGDRPSYAGRCHFHQRRCGDHRRRLHRATGGLSPRRRRKRCGADRAGARFGDGASGRNGGQLGTGQRAWPEEQEADFGRSGPSRLFAIAERGKAHLTGFAEAHDIDIDYRPGQISAAHKPGYVNDYRDHAALMADHYDYPHLTFLDREALSEKLGSTRYHGGAYDAGTGPYQSAQIRGRHWRARRHRMRAHGCTRTPGRGRSSAGGKVTVTTDATA